MGMVIPCQIPNFTIELTAEVVYKPIELVIVTLE